MMKAWCEFAKLNKAQTDGGSYIGANWKVLLHTTEAKWFRPSSSNYYGHSSYPHFTIEPDGTIWQHIPITRAARATKNLSGGVQTNRANMIQIEICWKAVESPDMPKVLLDAIVKLTKWIMSQVPVPAVHPDFVAYPKSYGQRNGIRFSHSSWYDFNGILGHQHVPENDHGDPGAMNMKYIVAALTGSREERRYEMVVYAKRGTPDFHAASAAVDALGRGVATCNLDEAKAAVARGEVTVALGGPAARDLGFKYEVNKVVRNGHRVAVVGQSAIDTFALCNQLA